MKTYVLQHVPFEKPGILDELEPIVIKLFESDHQLPNVDDIDFLIILGGPMSVHDDFKWLKSEKLLIKMLIERNIPMLGICLGAQLIAEVLGSAIYINSKGKEVGFSYIQKQTNNYAFLPEELDVLHWHGDTFTLPENAVRLYSSNKCVNQAFIYNERVIGLQFHMETTKNTLNDIIEADHEYIKDNVLNQTKALIAKHQIPEQNKTVLIDMINYITGGLGNEK